MSKTSFSNIYSNPRCLVLIGPPCSGKSTYRETMIPTLNEPVVISGDDLVEEQARALGKSYSEVWPGLDTNRDTLRSRFKDAVNRKVDIIIDMTNMTAKSRRRYTSGLTQSYTRIAVVFDFVPDMLFHRLEKRGDETGKKIPRAAVEEMIARYQEPEPSDFHEIIRINSFV